MTFSIIDLISLIDTGTIVCLPLIWIGTRNDNTWTSARNKEEEEEEEEDDDQRNLIKVICKKIALFSVKKFSKMKETI